MTAIAQAPALPYAESASRELLDRLLVFGAGLLLFGDYLALSASHYFTGVPGNWVLYAGVAQLGVLTLAIVLGRLRGALLLPRRSAPAAWGWCG